ncbi:MAG: LLM class flavin-dependent oxidoreductase [Gemmobacter sp.]|nr:LLM class flavin-dependent oxidoreductase [Gemmobacter sp.]
MHYSLLDLSPIPEGHTAADALSNTLDLARHAEAAGYHRFWLAEHHNMAGIASAATAVVIGHVAAGTRRIRVGSGGVMLPNHSPLVIAEQFGTLATLFPGRIDLGVGRAPGTDMATARALRRNMDASDAFPQDVMELMAYFAPGDGSARIRAIPGEGTEVPVWILGSSLYGAQLAAYLGLPYAFASHFAPDALEEAADVYRRTFRPSGALERPYFMMAMGVYAGETDAEGDYLKSSMQQAFANLRTGQPGPLPRPVHNIAARLSPAIMAGVNQALACSVSGGPSTVRSGMARLIDRLRPDEVILAAQIHDHAARVRSFQIAAEALSDMAQAA